MHALKVIQKQKLKKKIRFIDINAKTEVRFLRHIAKRDSLR